MFSKGNQTHSQTFALTHKAKKALHACYPDILSIWLRIRLRTLLLDSVNNWCSYECTTDSGWCFRVYLSVLKAAFFPLELIWFTRASGLLLRRVKGLCNWNIGGGGGGGEHCWKSERGSDRAKRLQLRSLICPVQAQWQHSVWCLFSSQNSPNCPLPPGRAFARMIYNAYESLISRWQC